MLRGIMMSTSHGGPRRTRRAMKEGNTGIGRRRTDVEGLWTSRERVLDP